MATRKLNLEEARLALSVAQEEAERRLREISEEAAKRDHDERIEDSNPESIGEPAKKKTTKKKTAKKKTAKKKTAKKKTAKKKMD